MLPLYQAFGGEAINGARDAAGRQTTLRGEVGHPEPLMFGTGQSQQHFVAPRHPTPATGGALERASDGVRRLEKETDRRDALVAQDRIHSFAGYRELFAYAKT
jgi:hypothetical protein